jgi:hypothetical protein
MGTEILNIFAEGVRFQLTGLLGLGLFLVLAAIQEIREDRPEGFLYLLIAVFLFSAHGVMLTNALSATDSPSFAPDFGAWDWLASLFAPALIALFVLRALFNFAVYQGRDGLYKLFFGSTLACYLYLLGSAWPPDVRGILTVVWVGFFFKTEMAIAN